MTHQLMHVFSIGAGELGVLSAAFYYSYTIMQIPAGIILDRLGARKILTVAVSISACGVIVFALSQHLLVAGVGRFLIGFGSSFAFVGSLFLASRWFAHKYFAMIVGFVQLGGSLGSIFGLAPLALVINRFGWRESLLVSGLLTFVFAGLFWLVIRDGRNSAPQDTVKKTWRHEGKSLIHLLRQRQLWWVALCSLASWVPVATVGALWGVPYLMTVYGVGNVVAGKIVSLFWVGLAVASPFGGWFSNYINRRRPPLIASFSIAVVAALLLIFATNIPLWVAAAALFLLGVSSSVQAMSFGLIKDIVPMNMLGTASGINNMGAVLGGALSQPLVGYLLHLHWNGVVVNNTPVYSISNYQKAFVVLPVVALIGLVASLFFVKETYCQQRATF